MADLIQGNVSYVMDRRTFSIEVTHVGAKNRDQYLKQETVRINSLLGLDRESLELGDSKKELERLLNEKRVRCRVMRRDSYRRIIATVYLLETETTPS